MPLRDPSSSSQADADIDVDAARAAIAAALSPVTSTETAPLMHALGRVLADDVVSPLDVPPHDNAAMDGYAFDGAALAADQPLRLRKAGTLLAGGSAPAALKPGECLRIMTGAALPPGLDTVVPLELSNADDAGNVHVAAGAVRPGEHRRRRGEDLARGQVALRAGRVLRPADLGLVASLGLVDIGVRRRLRVALFSTGNEIVAPGQPLPAGHIYDSNRASLAGALQRLGMDVLDLGLVPDDAAALGAALERAAREADAVVTSGGVSAGDADHTRQVLALHGDVTFWKVAMRPGRPFAFGPLRGGAWLFALPGNPVAALVAFHVLVRDGLLRLAGAEPQPLPLLRVRSATAIRKRPGRSEFQRALLSVAADGSPQVQVLADQGSGILRSMSEANALVRLGHGQGPVAAGEWVDVWPFDGLL